MPCSPSTRYIPEVYVTYVFCVQWLESLRKGKRMGYSLRSFCDFYFILVQKLTFGGNRIACGFEEGEIDGFHQSPISC